jgi:c-di-GMP-binding flagellar brake protein YcgR
MTISERRETPRLPIALEVMLRQADNRFTRCMTRDVSLDGLYLQTTDDVKLASKGNSYMAIKIPRPDGQWKIHHFHARPVHIRNDGAAFVFDTVDEHAYSALLNLVFTAQPRRWW